MDLSLYGRPRYLALALGVIVALGGFALNTVGRQEDPTITNLFATVITPWPGAEPERVEALVTEKIEAELREIPEIAEIASVSRAGVSSVQIELSAFTPDDRIDQVWSEVRDALADAARALPEGVPEPEFDNDRTGAFTLIVALGAREGREAPMGLLTRAAEALQDRLRGAPQTKLVELYGAAEEEVRVEVDPDALAVLGLAPQAVAQALAGADPRLPAGRVRGDRGDFGVEIAGGLDSLARIREAPVAAGPDGRVVRVGDIAEVRRDMRDPPAEIAYAGGRRAVLVAARMEDDAQVDRWAAGARAVVAAFAAEAAGGLAVEIVFDQSGYTAARFADVGWNLAGGMALVAAVLLLSVGWRSALIVSAMMPLAALLTLAVLDRLGVTLHQMSITGLIVALGLVVDAAVVMTEEIRRDLALGGPRAAAVSGAARRLAIPLAASTLTTMLAFAPMAALPGPAGDFVGAIAAAVIVMLGVSFLLALTVTPALAGLFLDGRPAEGARWWRDGLGGGAVGRLFDASLAAAMRWRGLAAAVASLPALVGFLAFPTLTAQFFPGVDRDQFYVQLDLPEGGSIRATEAAALAAEAILRADPAVRDVQWSIGRSAPAFYYNMLPNRDADPGFAEALVTTVAAEATPSAVTRLQRALDEGLPGAQALVRGLVQGPPVDAPVELRIVGPSLGALKALGEQARAVMGDSPDVTHTRADLSGAAPKLVLDLDADRARLAGLDLVETARRLEAMAEGVEGGRLVEGTEEMPVRVRLPGPERADAAALGDLTLAPEGARAAALAGGFSAVPVRALGALRLAPSDAAIARRNGERVNTVQAFVAQGVLPEEALADIRARLDAAPLPLPPGYRLEWGGDSDARGETVRNLISTVGLVVVASVAAIVLTFDSWRLSAVAFVVCGQAMGLGLLALALGGYPFGIQALIGVIGSIGVSVNAAIIIMSALQEDPAAARGDPDAIRRVTMAQGRHIVSTSVTNVVGFLPLILGGGAFWPPFAVAIAGGVALSTVVSFWFVPPAFALLVGRRPVAAAATLAPPAVPALRLAAE